MSVSGVHHHVKAVTALRPLRFQKQLRCRRRAGSCWARTSTPRAPATVSGTPTPRTSAASTSGCSARRRCATWDGCGSRLGERRHLSRWGPVDVAPPRPMPAREGNCGGFGAPAAGGGAPATHPAVPDSADCGGHPIGHHRSPAQRRGSTAATAILQHTPAQATVRRRLRPRIAHTNQAHQRHQRPGRLTSDQKGGGSSPSGGIPRRIRQCCPLADPASCESEGRRPVGSGPIRTPGRPDSVQPRSRPTVSLRTSRTPAGPVAPVMSAERTGT
jgi:hypothetical protein